MVSIKQAADLLKVNANAIRFYEKRGLISPQRSDSGYRQFSGEEMNKLQLILTYRKMGFSIEAIQSLTSTHSQRNPLEQFVKQYTYLSEHIQAMQNIREVLGESIELLLSGSSDELDPLFNIEQMRKTAAIIEASNHWTDQWDFDAWAARYDEDIQKTTDGLAFYEHYDAVLDKTAEAIDECNIVEIGIGTGNLAKRVLERNAHALTYIGVDQSVNMLRLAKAKCPKVTPKIGTFLKLPLPDQSADAIVTSYALHHCNDEEKVYALLEMDRVLRAVGKIVVTDLMFKDQSARRDYERTCTPRQLEELQDEYFGTVDTLVTSLESMGYRVKCEQIDPLIWIIIGEKKDKRRDNHEPSV